MSIEIKGVIIGEGKPKVCVPIVESHDEAILNKLKEFNELEVDMIELRIDFYENIHQEDALRNLFLNIAALQIQKPVILTIRTAAEGGEVEIDPKDYFNVYKLAVEANAFDIYDVELALGTGHTNGYTHFYMQKADGGHIQVFDHGRIVENGRYGRVIYALITNLETVRENYGNSECNN